MVLAVKKNYISVICTNMYHAYNMPKGVAASLRVYKVSIRSHYPAAIGISKNIIN